MITVSIEYKIAWYFGKDEKLDNKLERLAKSLKGVCQGAGSGGGYRDIEFEFKSEEQAKVFKDKVKNVAYPGLRIL